MKHRNSLNKPEDYVGSFESIALKDLKNSELLDRKEVKYVFDRKLLSSVLNGLMDEYFILEIDDKRIFKYHSHYFDTEDLQLFHEHRRGRLNRYKIRKRHYVDSDLSFFEVKFKNNHGRTIKSRVQTYDQLSTLILPEEVQFLQKVSPFSGASLNKTLTVIYDRLTLVSKNTTERVTIDINLQLNLQQTKSSFDKLVVLEVKQDRLRNSPIKDKLKSLTIRPGAISKYCLGIIANGEKIRYNRFKPMFNQFYKPYLKTTE